MIINRDKAHEAVNILSGLILANGSGLGSRQHNPSADVDADDAYMAESERVIKELRDIRERLENLITGAV